MGTQAAETKSELPENLTDAEACACLMKRGLQIVAEAGAWEALPDAARSLFAEALLYHLGAAAKVADLISERDDEKALSNTLLAKLKERDETIKELRAQLRARIVEQAAA